MVIISGMADNRVNNPNIIKIEQNTSAKTAKAKEGTGPKPNGSAKVISSSPAFASF